MNKGVEGTRAMRHTLPTCDIRTCFNRFGATILNSFGVSRDIGSHI
jgi:hypothetical protein